MGRSPRPSPGERGEGGDGGGSVAMIAFHLKDDAPPGEAIINLLQNAGSTQTALGGIDAQGNHFLFDLEPRPSNVAGDALDGRTIVLPATGLASANVRTIADTQATPPQRRNNTVQDTRNLAEVWTSVLLLDEGNMPVLPAIVDGDNISQAIGDGLLPTWSGQAGTAPEQSGDLFWRQAGEEVDADSPLLPSCFQEPCTTGMDDWSWKSLP